MEESVSQIDGDEEVEIVSVMMVRDAVAMVVGAYHDVGDFGCASRDVSYPPLAFADVPSRASPVPIFPFVLRAAFVLLPAVDCVPPSLPSVSVAVPLASPG